MVLKEEKKKKKNYLAVTLAIVGKWLLENLQIGLAVKFIVKAPLPLNAFEGVLCIH